MAITIQLRRGTAAEWTSADPVLASGEIGVEVDTLQFKIGDGVTAWTVLAYAGGGGGAGGDASAANQLEQIALLTTLLGQTDGIESSLVSIDAGTPTALGQQARASSMSITLATEDIAALTPPAAITGFATAANQSTEIAGLASILAKLSADPASQTTLAAILSKIIAAPATEAKQDALAALIGEVQASPTANTVLDRLKQIHTDLSGTLAISAASLPLPSGAATSAKQDTGNTNLASIDTKTPALGQALAAASVPIVMTAAQVSALTPPAAIVGFATAANQATEIASLAAIDAGIPAALGQATAANSMPVVPASDYQAPIIPVNSTLTVTSVTANNADMVASTDMSNYVSGTLQIIGIGGGANVAVQFSLDGTTWSASPLYNVAFDSNNSTGVIYAANAVGLFAFDIPRGARMRIRTTAYTSGTISAACVVSSVAAPRNLVGLFGSRNGAQLVRIASALIANDAQTAPSDGLAVGAFPMLFNGTNADRQRNNVTVTALASAARTTTANADVITYNARAFRVILNITAAPNTPSTLTLAIRVKDSISGNYMVKLTATAITGSVITASVPNTTDLQIGAGLAVTANVSAAEAVARNMNVLVTHSNADSWTYSVSVDLGA